MAAMTAPSKPRRPTRFWRKVNKGSADECWPWTGRLSPQGYGLYRNDGAHRVSYEMLVGPIPAGLHLDHRCHVPAHCAGGRTCPHRRCVNPGHLDPVTPAENSRRAMRDHCRRRGHPFDDRTYVRKGGARKCRICHAAAVRRHRYPPGRPPLGPRVGESNGNAVLTQAMVDAMRAEYATGETTQAALAARYGIGKSQVHNVVRGKSWAKGVPPAPQVKGLIVRETLA
jgi:hypothetical protein